MISIEIFCDGSCLGNPGPGGWGTIVKNSKEERELSGGKAKSTNNEMELTAALEGLKSLKDPSSITVTTDSQYLTKGMTEWMSLWKKRGWKTSDKKPVKNMALWKELDSVSKKHQIKWAWVKGHAGHPENERCDILAKTEAEKF